MKTSLQMFKDLEVCDGAYEVLTEIFTNAGTEKIDYDEGYKMMLDMIEDLKVRAMEYPDPNDEGHKFVHNWVAWCDALPTKPEAIMYFGDHIEMNDYSTDLDDLLHASRSEAEHHIHLKYEEIKQEYKENFSVCGIKTTEFGDEYTVLRDAYAEVDLIEWSNYDKFSWSEMFGGRRFETTSPTEAQANYGYMSNFFNELDQEKEAQKQRIKRRIRCCDDKYEVFI